MTGCRNTLTKYQLDMLGGERVFRMLGGYAKNGQMEKLARMLNDGQAAGRARSPSRARNSLRT